jgi:tetratricopeptide (TPR) repeat protein
MKSIAALFALTLALSSCMSAEKRKAREQELSVHREYALRALDDGDLRTAESQVALGLELEPDDERLQLIQARLLLLRGTAEAVRGAESLFREHADDENFLACLGLAEALERLGVLHFESAGDIASGVRATTATDPGARAHELREEARRLWGESVAWYRKSLELKPDFIQTINGLQRVHALLGDVRASLEASERLLELADAEIAFWRAELARPEIRVEYEAELRRRISASSKLLTETHLSASTALVALGRAPDALAHLGRALEREPARAEIYSRRAQLELQLGRAQPACADLRMFLKLSTLPVEHPDMQRALDLLREGEAAVAKETAANS